MKDKRLIAAAILAAMSKLPPELLRESRFRYYGRGENTLKEIRKTGEGKMKEGITIQLIKILPNGKEFCYQFLIPELEVERDGVKWLFGYCFDQFMAEYECVKDNLDKGEEDERLTSR